MKITCPNCKNETFWENNPYRPFCGRECKERDLGNWATERYRVAAEEAEVGTATVKNERDRSGPSED